MSDCRELLREARAAIYGFDVAELIARIDAFLATPAADDGNSVPMPQNADQAALMCLLGHKWLETHAPERLRATPSAPASRVMFAAPAAPAEPVPWTVAEWVTHKPVAWLVSWDTEDGRASVALLAEPSMAMWPANATKTPLYAAPPPPSAEAEDAARLAEALREIMWEGVENLCDECGGESERCPPDCFSRKARGALAAHDALRAQEAKR